MRLAPILPHLFAAAATALVALAPLPATADPLPAEARAAPAAAALPAALVDLGDYVDKVRHAFDVPAISVAIVKDGELLLEAGWGARQVGADGAADLPADARTLYAIASNTKAFTAASLAMLADAGKLDLGDRVIDHLPWFRMADPYVTREMRVRDLLSHRSGLSLGAGDLLYWPTTDYTTREVVERLAQVPLNHGFRERYFYDNILFGVAQLVIEEVSGQSYRDFLQEHFFTPLGMADTRFNFHDLGAADTNVATGYAKFDFKDLKPTARLAWANNSGAGGIYSSVHDLTRWMRAQLAGGVYGEDADGEPLRLFSEARQREMWSVQTPIEPAQPPIDELAPLASDFAGYGEGWSIAQYRGRKLVWHGGGWPGFVSRLTLVPAENIGVVVLTNAESGAAFQAITWHVLDAFFGAAEHDWIGAYQAALARAERKADESWEKHVAARARRSRPSLPLGDYAGTWRDPWYGDVVLAEERGGLVLRFSRTAELVGDLEHWQHDSFIVRWRDRSMNADAFASFSLDADGKPRELRLNAISPRTDFSFDFQDLRLTPVAAE